VALYEAIDRTLGSGDFKLCFEIGRFTCDYEMTTINRIFLKFGSLEQWMRRGQPHVEPLLQRGRLDVEGFHQGGRHDRDPGVQPHQPGRSQRLRRVAAPHLGSGEGRGTSPWITPPVFSMAPPAAFT
jgi:hypothetical protein